MPARKHVLRRRSTRKHVLRRTARKSHAACKHVLRRTARKSHKHVLRRKYNKTYKGGNYTTDITTDSFEGFSYVNPNTTVVAYPGGVRSLSSYKNKVETDDMDGFNPVQ